MKYLFTILALLEAFYSSAQVFSLNDAAFTSKSSTLLNGLVGYWALEEVSGTRYDRSKNGNHLTANNSPTNTAAKIGFGANFSASSSQFLNGKTNIYENLNTFSVFCWVNLTTNSLDSKVIVARYNTPNNQRSWEIITASRSWTGVTGKEIGAVVTQLGTATSNFKAYWVTNSNICDQKWHHVGITFDNGTFNLYLDGQPQNPIKFFDQSVSSAFASTSPLTVAGVYSGSTPINFIDGSVDELCIYSRTLSNSEVLTIYNSGKGYPTFRK